MGEAERGRVMKRTRIEFRARRGWVHTSTCDTQDEAAIRRTVDVNFPGFAKTHDWRAVEDGTERVLFTVERPS